MNPLAKGFRKRIYKTVNYIQQQAQSQCYCNYRPLSTVADQLAEVHHTMASVMPERLRGVTAEEIKLRANDKLRRELGFKDTEEMNAFIKGPLFWPFFDEYAQLHIYPQQRTAVTLGTKRPRGPSCSTVETRMISGERPGRNKYSCRFPDKTQWEQVDHAAYLLYNIKTENIKNSDGLFFGKGMESQEITRRIWGLLKHAEYNLAPSLRMRQPDKLQKPSADSFVYPSSSSNSSPLSSPPGSPLLPPGVDEMPVYEDDEPYVLKPLGEEEKIVEHFKGNQQLTNAQKMVIENDGQAFSLDNRFWQAWIIDKIMNLSGDVKALRKDIDWAKNIALLTAEEQVAWYAQTVNDLTSETILYEPWSEEAAEDFQDQQRYFDNTDYQREDLRESCELLGIPWAGKQTVYRMDGMSLSQTLKFWQPPAIKALIEWGFADWTRGCILADDVGLGKTWTVICYLLYVSACNRLL